MVSTISISFELLSLMKSESMEQSAGVGQFWTPIMLESGSLLHADPHPPKRERMWRDKEGNIRKTEGVSRKLSDKFLNKLAKVMKPIDFEQEVDTAVRDYKSDDVPF
jgi:hypothetical protein